MSPALETRGLCMAFGGLKVTQDVSLKLERGARHALIGPNGAGKTTLVNQLTGVLRSVRRLHLARRRGDHPLRPDQRVRRGWRARSRSTRCSRSSRRWKR